MKKPKLIKLKIVKCNNGDCWYSNKIGRSYYFFEKIFTDDDGIESLWLAKPPTAKNGGGAKYVYIEDVNYNIYERKKKIEKINGI